MRRSPVAGILLSLLILTGAVAYAFGPILWNDFVNWDDQSEIIENPDLNPVTLKGLEWNWSNTRLSLYMPVTYMVWAGVAEIATREPSGTLNAMAFHALSLALHLICAGLVFLLIYQLWKHIWPALIGALVFAVHPLQSEPVAWASGMYTVLSSALSIGALMAYVTFATRSKVRTSSPRPGTPGEGQGEGAFGRHKTTYNPNHPHPSPLPGYRERGSSGFFLLATFLYLIALFTKAASVSLPLAAAVIDLFILHRPIRKMIWPLGLWVALGLPMIWLAKHFQDVSQIAAPSLLGRPVVALDAIGFYLRKIALPIGLIPDYGRNPRWVMQHQASAAVSAATAIFAILLAWYARRNAAWITVGIGLLIVGISPYLGLTTFDFQYVSTVADRYAYFGMVGIALLAAGAAVRSRAAGVVLLFVTAFWAVMTHQQVQKWQDTQTLFSHTLQVNPQSLVSHNVFGFLAAREGRTNEAEAHYLEALKVWPEDATIQFNLANLYRRSQPDLALDHYALAVKYQPGFVSYRNSYAAELAGTHQAEAAYNQWQQAIAIDPDYLDARNNLGDLLVNLGRDGDAVAQYHEALRIDPTNAHATDQLRRLEHSRAR